MPSSHILKNLELLWDQAVRGGWKEIEEHDTGSLSCLEQTGSRNLDLEDAACEGLKGSEKHFYWKLEEGESLFCIGKNFSNTVICAYMENNVPKELDDLAKEISKKSVEGTAEYFLAAYNKRQGGK